MLPGSYYVMICCVFSVAWILKSGKLITPDREYEDFAAIDPETLWLTSVSVTPLQENESDVQVDDKLVAHDKSQAAYQL